MINSLKLVLLSGILLFQVSALAQAKCSLIFSYGAPFETETTTVRKILPGKHGGQLFKIEKIHTKQWAQWGETEVIYKAPMGDPRWITVGLPVEVSNLLGIKRFDIENKELPGILHFTETHTMTLPDYVEINGAYAKLDTNLRQLGFDGVPFKFYPLNEHTETMQFIRKMSAENSFPMGLTKQLIYHDVNFHIMPLLILKKSWIAESNRKTKLLLMFDEWAKQNKPEILNEKWFKGIFVRRADEIDLIGNLSPYLFEAGKNGISRNVKVMGEEAVLTFVGRSHSPLEHLKEILEGFMTPPEALRILVGFQGYIVNSDPSMLRRNPEIEALESGKISIEKEITERLQQLKKAAVLAH